MQNNMSTQFAELVKTIYKGRYRDIYKYTFISAVILFGLNKFRAIKASGQFLKRTVQYRNSLFVRRYSKL